LTHRLLGKPAYSSADRKIVLRRLNFVQNPLLNAVWKGPSTKGTSKPEEEFVSAQSRCGWIEETSSKFPKMQPRPDPNQPWQPSGLIAPHPAELRREEEPPSKEASGCPPHYLVSSRFFRRVKSL